MASNISEMNKRITLQYPVNTPDGMGGSNTTFVTSTSVYAAIWPTSAKEHIEAMQTGITITHKIRIRYNASLAGSWRILWESRYFNIVAIIDLNMDHRWMDLLCKEAI